MVRYMVVGKASLSTEAYIVQANTLENLLQNRLSNLSKRNMEHGNGRHGKARGFLSFFGTWFLNNFIS